MVIRTFEYQVLSSLYINPGKYIIRSTRKDSFPLIVADKAKYVVHRAIKTANRNRSQFTSSTKTRSEVSGGGRKPWKQKGTGRARAGSNRSPLWRGGGVTFGPRPKSITKKINKKEKQLALRTILFNRQNHFIVVNNLDFPKAKTSDFLKRLATDTKKQTLVISSKPNLNLKLSVRNLKNFNYILADQLNVTEVAKAKRIIIDELSFQVIKEIYCDAN
jgi:large subunit ribosomal protein L4